MELEAIAPRLEAIAISNMECCNMAVLSDFNPPLEIHQQNMSQKSDLCPGDPSTPSGSA